VQVEGRRSRIGGSDGRSYTPAVVNSAEAERIEFHGVLEREECVDDNRSACEFEVQVWEPALLVTGIQCEHGWAE